MLLILQKFLVLFPIIEKVFCIPLFLELLLSLLFVYLIKVVGGPVEMGLVLNDQLTLLIVGSAIVEKVNNISKNVDRFLINQDIVSESVYKNRIEMSETLHIFVKDIIDKFQ
jgi:hypothetical protein